MLPATRRRRRFCAIWSSPLWHACGTLPSGNVRPEGRNMAFTWAFSGGDERTRTADPLLAKQPEGYPWGHAGCARVQRTAPSRTVAEPVDAVASGGLIQR